MFYSVHYKFLKKTCFATQDPMYSILLDFISHPKILPLGGKIEPATPPSSRWKVLFKP